MSRTIWLIRHGETEWSLSGAHTGRTDLPLTEAGCKNAIAVGKFLAARKFSAVFTSPLSRARETCRLAGYGDVAQVDPNLYEWNYGDYEGHTTPDIQKDRPGWSLWRDGVPNGETVEQVGERGEAVLARAAQFDGDVALFAHGHILRILTARYLGLSADCGRLFALGTASVSILGYERETRVISQWNLSTGA
jgi:probable phosphoglycerate mutase